MKKFKSMKKRDEKVESLLMERWGYSATILNEDGDKGLLQEFAPAVVVAAPTILGIGKAGWAIISTLALATYYGYEVYEENENLKASERLTAELDAMARDGIEVPSEQFLHRRTDSGIVGKVTPKEAERLGAGERPIVTQVPERSTPPLIVTTDEEGNEVSEAPSGWRFEEPDVESDNLNIVPDDDDPEVTDIAADVPITPTPNASFKIKESRAATSHLSTKDIVKEEVVKYFSNRRKS
jgi:hypothetical protein